MKEGYLPNIASLIRRGYFAKALAPIPTLTSTNWVTIATGAWPGTHGITDMLVHIKGESLEKLHNGFLTPLCKAEYLWNAAARAGKKSILIKYTASWPPNIKNGLQISGDTSPMHNAYLSISRGRLYSTDRIRGSTPVILMKAEGWINAPVSYSNPLETSFVTAGVRFHILIVDSNGSGYDKVYISTSKNAEKALTELRVGEWSKWFILEFRREEMDQKIKEWGTERFQSRESIEKELLMKGYKIPNRCKGTIRFKLIEISSDAKKFKLYHSEIFPIEGFTYPASLSKELIENVGPFIQSVGMPGIEEETHWEELEYTAQWLGNAAQYLMKKYEWDLIFTQWHGPDHVQHSVLGYCDPAWTLYDPNKAEKYWKLLRRCYEIADNLVGSFMENADDNTLIVVVSDHGCIPFNKCLFLNNLLAREGLLKFKKDPETGRIIIDWSKTKAYAQRAIHIYVNLKGRDPHGIVNPGEEYEEIVERIIDLLYSLRDPETGERPIALALRKEDASILGVWGDRVGDVIYVMNPGYEGNWLTMLWTGGWGSPGLTEDLRIWDGPESLGGRFTADHSSNLPTARLGVSEMKSLLIMAGPGIKKGYKQPEDREPPWLVDIAPTIAYLLGIPKPAQAEGKIIYDALEDELF